MIWKHLSLTFVVKINELAYMEPAERVCIIIIPLNVNNGKWYTELSKNTKRIISE